MGISDDFSNIFKGAEDPLDLFGGKAQDKATKIREMLSREGLDLRRDMFDQLFADQAPVRGARDEAIGLLDQINTGEFNPFLDPSLDFRKREGTKEIRQRLASQGKLGAGQRFLEEQDLSAGLASEGVNDAVTRVLNLAGFTTEDLSGTNPVLQRNVGGQSQSLLNLGDIRQDELIGNRNQTNQMLNTGGSLLGYYNPGGIFNRRAQ